MELYRKANVFERTLSLYSSPHVASQARTKVLQIMYRAIQVGGSMTLITRVGILSWLDIQLTEVGSDAAVLLALKALVENSCDRQEVDGWKSRSTQK